MSPISSGGNITIHEHMEQNWLAHEDSSLVHDDMIEALHLLEAYRGTV